MLQAVQIVFSFVELLLGGRSGKLKDRNTGCGKRSQEMNHEAYRPKSKKTLNFVKYRKHEEVALNTE